MPASSEDLVIPNLEEAVIGGEDNPLRFERFCAELYGTDQGVTVVTTGYSWDQGRDGRTLAGPPHILCGSLRDDVDKKSSEDIATLAKTSNPFAIVFCSSHYLSEHACDGIAEEIRKLHPGAQPIVLGRKQLGDLARKQPGVLRTHYETSISVIRDALLKPDYSSDAAQVNALRLALCTHGRADAGEFRRDLLNTIIVELLETHGDASENELAKAIYEDLRLSRPMKLDAIRNAVADLVAKGFVAWEGNRVSITDAGTRSLASPEAAASKLLEGRAAVRRTLENNLGYKLEEEEFAKLWNVLQTSLGDLFFENGLHVVKGIGLLLGEEPTNRDDDALQDLVKLIDVMSERAGLAGNTPDRQKDLAVAVSDAFLEPGSDAFEWLSEVAAVFVCIASLGFIGTSADALKRCISRTILVMDTDVLISFLCEAEPTHAECRAVYTGWRGIGGQLATAPVVLEEVAHHAWIAEMDFDETADLRARGQRRDAYRIITNAFVRSYWKKAEKFSKREFFEYLSEFRGTSERDYRRVQDVIVRDFKFSVIQEVGDGDSLATRVRGFLGEIQATAEKKKDYWEDKSRKDGRLLASAKAWRDRLRSEASDLTTCLLSSSTLLERADRRFRGDIGLPNAVMSVGSAAYLLSLLPTSRMTLAGMRLVLFEPKRRRFSQVQRLALRALAATSEYSFPFSRRATLLDKLDEALRREARARGVTFHQQENDFLSVKEPDSNARVIAKAVDELAVTTRLEKENEDLRRQLAEVKARLGQAKGKGK
jgi:hypothetical protein